MKEIYLQRGYEYGGNIYTKEINIWKRYIYKDNVNIKKYIYMKEFTQQYIYIN